MYLKKCFHSFDQDQIERWFRRKFQNKNVATCPTCREKYELRVLPSETREEAILRLFRKFFVVPRVPAEVNDMPEKLSKKKSKIKEYRDTLARQQEVASDNQLAIVLLNETIKIQGGQIAKQTEQIAQETEKIAQQTEQISQQTEQISQQAKQIAEQVGKINMLYSEIQALNQKIKEYEANLYLKDQKITQLEDTIILRDRKIQKLQTICWISGCISAAAAITKLGLLLKP